MNDPVTQLATGEIVANDQYQPRCDGLCEEHVAALMETHEDWPPIAVAHIDGSLFLVDGFHRHQAAIRLGHESIAARVFYPDSGADLFDIAFSLNMKHGRPLTLRDRKTYGEWLLQHDPELSDREIGRRTGLNHETVGTMRSAQRNAHFADRKPGALPGDVGTLDPIRFGRKATKEQKAIAGYVARLAIALGDPYNEDSTLERWSDDPADVARACVAAMGAKRAAETLRGLETDARFMLSVVKAVRTLTKEAS